MKIAVKIPLPCLSLTTNRDLHRGLAPVGFSQEQQAKGSLITLLITGDSNLEFKFKGGPGSFGEVIWEVQLHVQLEAGSTLSDQEAKKSARPNKTHTLTQHYKLFFVRLVDVRAFEVFLKVSQ